MHLVIPALHWMLFLTETSQFGTVGLEASLGYMTKAWLHTTMK